MRNEKGGGKLHCIPSFRSEMPALLKRMCMASYLEYLGEYSQDCSEAGQQGVIILNGHPTFIWTHIIPTPSLNKKYLRYFEEGFHSDEVQQDIVLMLTEILPCVPGADSHESYIPQTEMGSLSLWNILFLNPQAEHHLTFSYAFLETYFTVISTVYVVLWLFVYTFFFLLSCEFLRHKLGIFDILAKAPSWDWLLCTRWLRNRLKIAFLTSGLIFTLAFLYCLISYFYFLMCKFFKVLCSL